MKENPPKVQTSDHEVVAVSAVEIIKKAAKIYPVHTGDREGDADNNICRNAYRQGYEQAEKDLALTWEDAMHFRVVYDILDTLQENEELNVCPMSKEYYEEALRRFNELKRNRNENH